MKAEFQSNGWGWALVLLLISPLLGLAAFKISTDYESGKATEQFQEFISDRSFRLERETLYTAETLLALKAYFDSSTEVTRKEFGRFVEPELKRHPAIQALEWIPKIQGSKRREHELEARESGLQNYQITEQSDNETIVRASERIAYFPVYFVEPYEGNEAALGFDLGSDSIRRGALIRSIESAGEVLSEPIRLVQDAEETWGFLLILASYEGEPTTVESRHKDLRGLVLVVFQAEQLLREAGLISGADVDKLWHFRLLATDASEGGFEIYSCLEFDPAEALRVGTFERSIVFGGQTWKMVAYPTPDYFQSRRTHQPVFAGGGVCLTWALLSGFLFLLAKRSRDRALYSQAETIRTVLLSLNDGVVVSDSSGRFLLTNEAAAKILGPGPYEAPPEQWSEQYGCYRYDTRELYPPNQLPLARAVRGEKVLDEELLIRNQYCSDDVILNITGNPLKKPSGELTGGVVVFRNVTHRKESEAVMRRLSNIVKQTGDCVLVTDQKGSIEYVNPAFEQTTGYTMEQMLGKNPRILNSGAHRKEHFEELWKTITSGEVFRGTTINRRKDGSLFYNEQTITPMVDNNGRITHFVSVGKDMTERRKMQEQEIEMELAAKIQQKLFPLDFPQIEGFDISGGVFSASATCGDYFDFIRIGDNGLAVAVGDVSGHGFGSALIMAETRTLLRSFSQTQVDPAAMLFKTNAVLYQDLERNCFVTMALGIIDIRSSRLTFSSA
ncbi:MAG: CHASE domain-containing protein, partial [Acidobacteriota bacterium]